MTLLKLKPHITAQNILKLSRKYLIAAGISSLSTDTAAHLVLLCYQHVHIWSQIFIVINKYINSLTTYDLNVLGKKVRVECV